MKPLPWWQAAFLILLILRAHAVVAVLHGWLALHLAHLRYIRSEQALESLSALRGAPASCVPRIIKRRMLEGQMESSFGRVKMLVVVHATEEISNSAMATTPRLTLS
jgi:hypothetical protein